MIQRMVILLQDPHPLFSMEKVIVARVRIEEFGDGGSSSFDFFSRHSWHLSSHGAWSRVELRNIQHWEAILVNELECVFKLSSRFSRKAADDVSGQ